MSSSASGPTDMISAFGPTDMISAFWPGHMIPAFGPQFINLSICISICI